MYIYIYVYGYTNLYEIRNLKSMALEGIEELLEIWLEIFFFKPHKNYKMLTFKNSVDHSINTEHIGSIKNEYKGMEIMNKNI